MSSASPRTMRTASRIAVIILVEYPESRASHTPLEPGQLRQPLGEASGDALHALLDLLAKHLLIGARKGEHRKLAIDQLERVAAVVGRRSRSPV